MAPGRSLLAVLTTVALLALPGIGSATSTAERAPACTITGTAKADRLVGTAKRDVICGRGGNDVIKGGGGDDVLIGGGGRDQLFGGPGDDVLRAGGGNDLVQGEGGRDRLEGDGGNDDMDGGPAPDDIDGGSGTNWCSTDPADTQDRCVHDEEPAEAHEVRLSVAGVDVTEESRAVTVRVRVTDDTGVQTVQIDLQNVSGPGNAPGGLSSLESGTVRDGWWEKTITVPRWAEPGTYQVVLALRDRVNHWSHPWGDTATLAVIDRNPDRTSPVVQALSAPTSTFVADVRAASRTVPLRARVTDTQSGVSDVFFCLESPMADGYRHTIPCTYAGPPKSGTRRDGWYEGSAVIPKGAVGGDWNVAVWVSDKAHPGDTDFWYGPDHYRQVVEEGWTEPRYHELPGGAGRFQVIGTSDSTPPELVDLTATPATVDTLPGPVDITVRIRARDVEGVKTVGFALSRTQDDPTELPPYFTEEDFALESGTVKDGTWKAVLTLPQGTPAGTYYFQAWVEDATHWRSYVSASHDQAHNPYQGVMAWDPKVVVQP
jgi:hypothetical protein